MDIAIDRLFNPIHFKIFEKKWNWQFWFIVRMHLASIASQLLNLKDIEKKL